MPGLTAFLPGVPTFLPADFNVSTWLLLGATVQCALVALLPRNVALLPPVALLVYRILYNYLVANGYISNPASKDVYHGRRTWQIPSSENTLSTTGSTESIVVLVLAASWSHPNGVFSPGSDVMGPYMEAMWRDCNENREKYGFLGKTPQLTTQDDGRPDTQGKTMVFLSYWKTLEGLHKFAHASAHMKGQTWWEKGASEEFPHIGIMHEVYEVPAGNWENVFHNYRPFGICKLSSLYLIVSNPNRF
jgi:hypothetical protein